MKYSKCPTCGFATIYETNKPHSDARQWRVRHRKGNGYSEWSFTEDNDSDNRETTATKAALDLELQSELL